MTEKEYDDILNEEPSKRKVLSDNESIDLQRISIFRIINNIVLAKDRIEFFNFKTNILQRFDMHNHYAKRIINILQKLFGKKKVKPQYINYNNDYQQKKRQDLDYLLTSTLITNSLINDSESSSNFYGHIDSFEGGFGGGDYSGGGSSGSWDSDSSSSSSYDSSSSSDNNW